MVTTHAILAFAAALAGTSSALGINCRGDPTCGFHGPGLLPPGTLEQVHRAIEAGPEGNWTTGQHITCVADVMGRLCAFYQKIDGRSFNKQQTVAYLDQLKAHKCRSCGSVPTDPGNNVDNGEFTVNFVAD